MLNEYAYCPRLFHLEWVQSEWAENAETLDGSRVHQRVDKRSRRGLPEGSDEPPAVVRSVDLADEALGLIARIDLVEASPDGEAVPVDYKRGVAPDLPEGAYEPELVQLCAQAILLRAHGYRCDHGFLYFAGSRRRVKIAITEELVARTLALRDEARSAARLASAPPPLVDSPKCPGCSLVGICLPDEQNLLTARSNEKVRRIIPPSDDALPLHLTAQGAVLGKDGHELVVRPRDGEAQRVRLMDVSTVHVHGHAEITTPALRALMAEGIGVSYYSQGSWYYGRSQGHDHKNVLVRIAQFQAAMDDVRALELARRVVRAKIRNSRVFLRRNLRTADPACLEELDKAMVGCERAESLASLLGVEGNAARIYFGAFPGVLTSELGSGFSFEGRNRRPPQDPVNALLSFAYALLTSAWTHTLAGMGLDPYLGFYHQPRYGRPALALDMMEEYRSIIADSVVVGVINRGHLGQDDFQRTKTGVALNPGGKRRFVAAFERRMDEQITHPIFGYKMTYRRIFDVQARLLARHLVGEIDEFPELRPR
ncbi:MAG: CRISPR-associated endonuclease Cas1 [Deltaproteobacteria bacterium]|nr:CRISPR-associated endonuclease Cas1 [Deltaproteobacteria bacterium]